MKIHFIGIGGIGVSALAKYYLAQGHEISGSDLVESEITKALREAGIKIFIGKHRAKNLPKNINLVIYSPAVDKNNPEIKAAITRKIKILSYPEALGQLTKKHFTIAICGSHGKSTVAGMIGLVLTKAKLDPTVILGTKLREFNNSNCRVGRSKYLVIEADEYKESFLNYWPKIIVLLNIEYDHPDYFKDLRHYILAFKKFISHLPEDGVLILNEDDKIARRFFKKKRNIKMIEVFSKRQKEAKILKKILKIPGEFNVLNALATLKVARILGIPDKIAFKVFAEYKGSWRRFEIKKIEIDKKNVLLIDDYGHHPTQIRETIRAAREKFKKKKIILVYQPHQYQRTFRLWHKFINVFREIPADQTIITDIYMVPGRENKKIIKKINSEKLVKSINLENTIYLPKSKIINFLKTNLKGGEVVIMMGAGDIYTLSNEIKNKKGEKPLLFK